MTRKDKLALLSYINNDDCVQVSKLILLYASNVFLAALIDRNYRLMSADRKSDYALKLDTKKNKYMELVLKWKNR